MRPSNRRVLDATARIDSQKTRKENQHCQPVSNAIPLGLPVTFAYNQGFASGVASSLREGLAHVADSAGALILLADMPGVTNAILDQLIAAFERAPGCAAVTPVSKGRRGNPVLLGSRLFASVARLTGDEGARRLLRLVDGVIEIDVDDESVLADIDTQQDLERALGPRS